MQAAPTSIAPARERAEALGDERRRVRDSGVRGRGREQDQVDVARVDAGARERPLRRIGGDIGQGHLGRGVAPLDDSGSRLDPVAIDAEPRADRVVGDHSLGQCGGDRGDTGRGDRRCGRGRGGDRCAGRREARHGPPPGRGARPRRHRGFSARASRAPARADVVEPRSRPARAAQRITSAQRTGSVNAATSCSRGSSANGEAVAHEITAAAVGANSIPDSNASNGSETRRHVGRVEGAGDREPLCPQAEVARLCPARPRARPRVR